MEEDEGDVRVTVDPSASHYHAGENATFTISFTNTRATPTQTPRPAMPRAISDGQAGAYARSRGHRRAVSSVSEARMARPPTSPGLRRPTPPVPPKYSPSASTSSSTSPKASRQGLIGQRRLGNGNRMHPLRSLSVAITSHSAFHELVDAQDEHDGVVALNGSGTPTTPTHPSRESNSCMYITWVNVFTCSFASSSLTHDNWHSTLPSSRSQAVSSSRRRVPDDIVPPAAAPFNAIHIDLLHVPRPNNRVKFIRLIYSIPSWARRRPPY